MVQEEEAVEVEAVEVEESVGETPMTKIMEPS